MADRSNATPRFGWLAGAGTVLAIAACYGTLATVSVLSLLGVTLVINPGVWAGAISLFAVLALFGVLLSYREHRVRGPLVIAALGTALVLWAMFGSYIRIIELIGFAGLITAAVWDWRLKKCESPTGSAPDVAKRGSV
ncbi:MAG: MerC domain-containing protein [Nitrospiraceae bacterium]